MPILCVYVEQSKADELNSLLRLLQRHYGYEVILERNNIVETENFILSTSGKRPFFKAKQDIILSSRKATTS